MKVPSKSSWGYIVPTLFLIAGGIFLFYKSGGTATGILSGGYKSYGYFSGGSSSRDELDVKSVRWHTHNGYERLVFDIQQWSGVLGDRPYELSKETGVYEIGTELKHTKYIDGELSGFRDFSATLPAFPKSKMLKKMQIFPNGENSYLFRINLKKKAAYKVFTLKNPARIIIDIR